MAIKITAILPARGQIDKFRRMMKSFQVTTHHPENIEILVGIDADDAILFPVHKDLEREYSTFNLRFMVFETRSDHFTKHYWNPLAKAARGRWIFPIACDHEIMSTKWDVELITCMERKAKRFGDDIIHGLIKDNIKRTGEHPLYPNFSCHPVQSKEFVDAFGYFFDERCWVWSPDHIVTKVYRKLFDLTGDWRISSLMGVYIASFDSIHTTKETDPVKLEEMRKNDANFQRFCKIESEHHYPWKEEDFVNEAQRIAEYLERKHK
jgi:hypothetical protein